jgi:thioredoxin-dependent peroxiredoxin
VGLGAGIFGVSVDDVASHRLFAEKYDLNYPLLSDTQGRLSAAMGVLNKLGPIQASARVTFLVDRAGRVARVFDPVQPSGHADAVLAALAALTA